MLDGFLAPYKVIKVHIDRDVEGYRPEQGQLDRDGNQVEDRIYNLKDFDRTLVLDERTKLVAQQGHPVSEGKRQSLPEDDPLLRGPGTRRPHEAGARSTRTPTWWTGTTATSCASPAATPRAKRNWDNFIDPESKHPVLVTTSRLLSTGIDVQTCRLIVLDRQVGSMTEFKQILGRGTRVHEDTRKLYFTSDGFPGRHQPLRRSGV